MMALHNKLPGFGQAWRDFATLNFQGFNGSEMRLTIFTHWYCDGFSVRGRMFLDSFLLRKRVVLEMRNIRRKRLSRIDRSCIARLMLR